MPSPVLMTETRRSAGRRSARTVTVPPARRVARRVREQVGQHLGQVVGVRPRRQLVRDLERDHRARRARATAAPGRPPSGPPPRGRSRSQRGGADGGVAFGQRVERTRQPDQPIGLLVERLVGRPVRRDDAVAQRLEIALQVRQRRAELVRGVGDEVAAHRLLPLEAGGHLVERVGERGELLGAFARDAGRVVALGDRAGRPRRRRRSGRASIRASSTARTMLASAASDERGDDHGRDRLVVHRARVIGRIAGLDHERGEDVGSDDGHADREDDQPDRRRRERRERDLGPRSRGRIRSPDRRARPDTRRRGPWPRSAAARRRHRACRAAGRCGRRWSGRGSRRRRGRRRVEQLVADEDPAVGLEDRLEQPELDVGQVDRPVGQPDLVAVGVEDAGRRGGCRSRARGRGRGRRVGARSCRGRRAPQDRLHAEDQLGRRERLRQVVVGAVLETGDPVDGRAARREDDDRRRGRLVVAADRADDGPPVQLGEHQVEDDERRLVGLDGVERGRPVRGGHDREALALEVGPHQPDDLRVVIDDEDRSLGTRLVRGSGHRQHGRGARLDPGRVGRVTTILRSCLTRTDVLI